MSYASHCARAEVRQLPHDRAELHPAEVGRQSTGIICTQGHRPRAGCTSIWRTASWRATASSRPGEDRKAVTYTTKGKTQAYVQFKQEVPEGFERLGLWPTDLFPRIAPAAASGFQLVARELLAGLR